MNLNKQNTIDELIREIKRPDVRIAMFIGAAGTGKTTLIEKMVAVLSPKFTVGIVDADIGQSHLGPPATVAWGRVVERFPGWDSIPVESYYFTGAISPTGNLLQLVTGVKLMTDQALAACGKVLVDTAGLVTGSAAMALKHIKIDILKPDLLVALERHGELTHILDPLQALKHPRVTRFPVSSLARDAGPVERADYRRKKFGTYFTGAESLRLSLEHTCLRYTRDVARGKLFGKLVSLRDDGNTDLALGIIEALDTGSRQLRIRTNFTEPERVAVVMVGVIEAGF